jgi:hypothetical protein
MLQERDGEAYYSMTFQGLHNTPRIVGMALTLPHERGCQNLRAASKPGESTMAKLVINVLALTILAAFGSGTVVHAQETVPATPELPTPPMVSTPAPAEVEKKLGGEKERKSKKGKKAGRGKKKGKHHGQS